MKKIGIVGCGPRGLAALENLISSLVYRQLENDIEIIIIEPNKQPGAGDVWSTDQSDANWINISLRALEDLPGREAMVYKNLTIPAFTKITNWMSEKYQIVTTGEKDKFPKRAIMGEYLHERFLSIYGVLERLDICTVVPHTATSIDIKDDQIAISDDQNKIHLVDECLLTVGHQKTKIDDQIKSWQSHADAHDLILFTSPYLKEISKKIKPTETVGLRGFGLGMIDVIRLFTTEREGQFTQRADDIFLDYEGSSTSIQKMIPFSLDGLPSVPKPLNSFVDQQFIPDDTLIDTFSNKIDSALQTESALNSIDFLYDAFADCVANMYYDHFDLTKEELKSICTTWLKDQKTKHDLILDTDMDVLAYMKTTVLISCGEIESTLDYSIMQLWRHLQPSMYRLFSHCGLEDDLMSEVISLDESTKRYSYGPPVESIKQLVALAESNVLCLDHVNNPEISLCDRGWQIGESKSLCEAMIDTVLSPPKVLESDSEILQDLIHHEKLKLVASDLGFDTVTGGIMVSDDDNLINGLAMVGRNCKGSVMGVDAILECFGPRITEWADGVCKRMK